MSDGTRPSAVTVVGSIHMNLVASAPRVPIAGETLLGGGFAQHPGGKGSNQAAAAALQGVPVFLVGRVGQDAIGDALRAELRAKNVDLSFVGVDAAHGSGVSLVMTGADGEYASIVVPGAGRQVGAADLAAAAPAFAASTVAMVQLELGIDMARLALEEAKRAGCRTMLTTAPAPEGPLPNTLWRVVDVVLANRHEAAALAGDLAFTERAGETAVADLAARLGVATVVVTLGADGVVAAHDGQMLRLPAWPVAVIDTLGAGDALAGVLASGLARGQALPDALRTAVAAGALAVTRAGAFEALPAAAEIAAFLRRRASHAIDRAQSG